MAAVITSIFTRLQELVERFMPALNQLILFFFIVFISFLVGKMLGRLARKLLVDLKADAWLRRLSGVNVPLARLVGGFVAAVLYTLGFILALRAVGLGTTAVLVLALVFLVSVLLGLLVALRDLIPNALAGLTLDRRHVRVGAWLRMEGVEGRVVEVALLETHVESREGELIIIPNALFTRRTFTLKPVRR